MNPIQLEIYKHLFAAIADEMGVILRRTAYSPNIKERRDYSCAVFDAQGAMVAQAAHIPVHLGSMPLSVLAAIERFLPSGEGPKTHGERRPEGLAPGDVILVNDPFQGGTHLPDITLVSPVFVPAHPGGHLPSSDRSTLAGFVANRAHHADVGGFTPGSMGLVQEIYQEGLRIPPVKLYEGGRLNASIWDLVLANVRTPLERAGDLQAQVAANLRGVERLQALVGKNSLEEVSRSMEALLVYSEKFTRALLAQMPDGNYEFQDYLDEVDPSGEPVSIKVMIKIQGEQAEVDFSGSAPQQPHGINVVYAITTSAVYYVFRCLIGLDIPNNSGCLRPITLKAPQGSIVNARPPAAVAAGNVETSQRLVDVLLGALAQALPERVPAASQGTMNNLLIGGWDPIRRQPFAYYETIAGGTGAGPASPGFDAVHSHMTNTLNTPVEALEFAYPMRVERYEILPGTGGAGARSGGSGLRRDIRVLADATGTLLGERRRRGPYGLKGGRPGYPGQDLLMRAGQEIILPGKGSFDLLAGDVISIRTPGGGGYGAPTGDKMKANRQ